VEAESELETGTTIRVVLPSASPREVVEALKR